ncbi:hypothetical protein BJ684DRAFT_16340 [Piptocephalis cylindrospora]|uniref:Anaphase-promoting complex subunit 4 n=1 Tax=Piptocephalis cylindrospora TaxID=1907219 RepID=A0A4P9Y2U7_9FUNG|nr:hypothetical protein BJ684DRAFT_16340 [Piptocephalis cylindrospora]|eukprot:RKP13246.1 hypothetical protein BJ684DRAFT_16340 [Piptocephalis cylindrospora]
MKSLTRLPLLDNQAPNSHVTVILVGTWRTFNCPKDPNTLVITRGSIKFADPVGYFPPPVVSVIQGVWKTPQDSLGFYDILRSRTIPRKRDSDDHLSPYQRYPWSLVEDEKLPSSVDWVSWAPEGHILLVACRGAKMLRAFRPGWQEIWSCPVNLQLGVILAVAWREDALVLAVAYSRGPIRFIDVNDGLDIQEPIEPLSFPSSDPVRQLLWASWSPKDDYEGMNDGIVEATRLSRHPLSLFSPEWHGTMMGGVVEVDPYERPSYIQTLYASHVGEKTDGSKYPNPAYLLPAMTAPSPDPLISHIYSGRPGKRNIPLSPVALHVLLVFTSTKVYPCLYGFKRLSAIPLAKGPKEVEQDGLFPPYPIPPLPIPHGFPHSIVALSAGGLYSSRFPAFHTQARDIQNLVQRHHLLTRYSTHLSDLMKGCVDRWKAGLKLMRGQNEVFQQMIDDQGGKMDGGEGMMCYTSFLMLIMATHYNHPSAASTPKAEWLRAIGQGELSPALEAYLHRAPSSSIPGKSGLDEWSDVALDACDVIGRMLQNSLLPSIERMFAVMVDLLGYSRSKEHFGSLTPDETKIQYIMVLLTVIGKRGGLLIHLLQNHREDMHHFFGFLGYLQGLSARLPKDELVSFPDATGILGILRFLKPGLENDYLLGLLHPKDGAEGLMEQMRNQMGLGLKDEAESWRAMEPILEELRGMAEDQVPDLASLAEELATQVQEVFSETWKGCSNGIEWGRLRREGMEQDPWISIPPEWMGLERCFVGSTTYKDGRTQYTAMKVDIPSDDKIAPALCILRLDPLSGLADAWTLSLEGICLKSLVFLQCKEYLVGVVTRGHGTGSYVLVTWSLRDARSKYYSIAREDDRLSLESYLASLTCFMLEIVARCTLPHDHELIITFTGDGMIQNPDQLPHAMYLAWNTRLLDGVLTMAETMGEDEESSTSNKGKMLLASGKLLIDTDGQLQKLSSHRGNKRFRITMNAEEEGTDTDGEDVISLIYDDYRRCAILRYESIGEMEGRVDETSLSALTDSPRKARRWTSMEA